MEKGKSSRNQMLNQYIPNKKEINESNEMNVNLSFVKKFHPHMSERLNHICSSVNKQFMDENKLDRKSGRVEN